MSFWSNTWIIRGNGVSCRLPGHRRCALCSISIASLHEPLHFRLHNTDLFHDCLLRVASFCFSRKFLRARGRTGAAIMTISILDPISTFAKVFRVGRLRLIPDWFQDALDMLTDCKAICRSSITSVGYVSNPDRHSIVTWKTRRLVKSLPL